MNKLILAVLLLASAQAHTISGNQLLEYCEAAIKDAGEVFKAGQCIGYVNGLVDTHDNLVDWNLITKQFCIPKTGHGRWPDGLTD